ncbi:MAG TPA: hypothetical protein DDW27_20780 [Bacteroidales bacterium]|nr:hypothetical protein [Bacteroidales bacterium]
MKSIFKNRFFVLVILIFLPAFPAFSQEIPHPVSNTGVYDFLDELANDQVISINSVIKPYSRSFIAKCLGKADEKRAQLTRRQQEELDFYLLDFRKEGSTVRGFNGSTVWGVEGSRVQ